MESGFRKDGRETTVLCDRRGFQRGDWVWNPRVREDVNPAVKRLFTTEQYKYTER